MKPPFEKTRFEKILLQGEGQGPSIARVFVRRGRGKRKYCTAPRGGKAFKKKGQREGGEGIYCSMSSKGKEMLARQVSK